MKHKREYSLPEPSLRIASVLTTIDEDILFTTVAMEITIDCHLPLFKHPVITNPKKASD